MTQIIPLYKQPHGWAVQTQFDSAVGPLMDRLNRDPFPGDHLMSFKGSPLSGKEAASMLGRIRNAIPDLALLPVEERIGARVDFGRITVNPKEIPLLLEKMREAVRFNYGSLQIEAPENSFTSVGRYDAAGIVSKEYRTAIEQLREKLSSWIFDPGNPEKGKKYIYSLFCTRAVLDRKFKRWQARILPYLVEQAASSPFAKHAYFALNALDRNADSEADIRLQYAYIINHVRQALEEVKGERLDSPERKEVLKIMKELCHAKFTGVHMYPFLEDMIAAVLRNPQGQPKGPYDLPLLALNNLADEIQIANDRLRTVSSEYGQRGIAREYKKLQGTLGWGFDPLKDSNVPWVHSVQDWMGEDGQSRKCTVLRHGTPTSDPGIMGAIGRVLANGLRLPQMQQAVVIPEYRAFLAAHPDQKIFYCNHQEYDETGQHWVSAEIDRGRALNGLQEDFPNFYFLSLPLDGIFWKKDFLEKMGMDELRSRLFASLRDQVNGFGFPKNLKFENHERPIRAILEQIEPLYFQGDASKEKEAFILLFYSELKDYLKGVVQADYLVSACKDNKDRGNASTTVDMIKNLVKLGKENDPEALREVFISVLSPFIIKNEAIIPERLDLALKVIRALARLPEDWKMVLREKCFTGFQIQKQSIPKETASWAQMVGGKQLIEIVNHMRDKGEVRAVESPEFTQSIIKVYKKQECWDLARLKRQIVKDIEREMEVSINAERVGSFKAICDQLNLDEDLFEKRAYQPKNANEEQIFTFLSMLNQGAIAACLEPVFRYLDGNVLGMTVKQSALQEPTRISAIWENGIRSVDFEQEMSFFDPLNPKINYPIDIRGYWVGDGRPSKITWSFQR